MVCLWFGDLFHKQITTVRTFSWLVFHSKSAGALWKLKKSKRHKQISNKSQTMVRSFSCTSFPLNISWWQLKSHLFYTSSRISYICVSKEQFPIWNVKNYWTSWKLNSTSGKVSLLLVAAYSMSADSHYQLFNFPSLSVHLLQQSNTIEDCRDLSNPLLLYNCKHITGECKLFPTPLLNRNSLISNETVPELENLTWDGCKLLSRYSQGGHQ